MRTACRLSNTPTSARAASLKSFSGFYAVSCLDRIAIWRVKGLPELKAAEA